VPGRRTSSAAAASPRYFPFWTEIPPARPAPAIPVLTGTAAPERPPKPGTWWAGLRALGGPAILPVPLRHLVRPHGSRREGAREHREGDANGPTVHPAGRPQAAQERADALAVGPTATPVGGPLGSASVRGAPGTDEHADLQACGQGWLSEASHRHSARTGSPTRALLKGLHALAVLPRPSAVPRPILPITGRSGEGTGRKLPTHPSRATPSVARTRAPSAWRVPGPPPSPRLRPGAGAGDGVTERVAGAWIGGLTREGDDGAAST
jgi:hypothetical protein